MEPCLLSPQDAESITTAINVAMCVGVVFGLAIAPWAYWLVRTVYRYFRKEGKENA